MVNISSLLSVLATVAVASACVRTCEASSDAGGVCNYTCWRACSSLPETTVRNNFLRALQNNGHECSAVGANGLKCTKNTRFGSCGSHYWNCGSGC